ncbi:MAG: bifunctional phosphopantothenoylcysteine decarboxylase/phosphopantothenate--cysteine ligase CoaBC [Armatimonadota bacterium]
MNTEILKDKKILLGVTGSIAAYKAADLASKLTQASAEVDVVMTQHAAEFIGAATFRALTRHAVLTDLFDEPDSRRIAHIELAQQAELILVCPATANIIAKMAAGIADDLLSTLLLVAKCQVYVAPAMNTSMWEHPAVQANVNILAQRGIAVIQPESGRLACGDVGAGKLPTTEQLLAICAESFARPMAGKRVLITAGPTEEPIDAVRCLTNRSSGKMGYALAEVACRLGADVTLVAGPVSQPVPAGAQVVSVRTTQQMYDAVMAQSLTADIVIAAAAPSDYRVEHPVASKIKKDGNPLNLMLVENPDIIATVGSQKREDQVVIAFAAETELLLERCRQKLISKSVDMVVGNDVSKPQSTFGSDSNEIWLVTAEKEEHHPVMSKRECARVILDRAFELLEHKHHA